MARHIDNSSGMGSLQIYVVGTWSERLMKDHTNSENVMANELIDRMVEAGLAAIHGIPYSSTSAEEVSACIVAALRSLVAYGPTQLDGRGVILTGSALDATVIVIEGIANRMEKYAMKYVEKADG